MTKSLTAELAKRIGRDRKATETLLQGLSHALARHCGDLDTVAVPSFGNFIALNNPEKIITDLSTGKRIMLPPVVELTFRPAGKLRKLAENKTED